LLRSLGVSAPLNGGCMFMFGSANHFAPEKMNLMHDVGHRNQTNSFNTITTNIATFRHLNLPILSDKGLPVI
jgi:hypothetical protein